MRARVRVVLMGRSAGGDPDLVRMLEAGGDIVVVGEAGGTGEALALIRSGTPDAAVVDLAAPASLGAVERITRDARTPVLVLATAPGNGRSPSPLEALAVGAVDAVPRPDRLDPDAAAVLRRRLARLRGVRVGRPRLPAEGIPERSGMPVVAMAASTGGPPAMASVLSGLSGLPAPVLVVQHLHPSFIGGFVDWVSRLSALPVDVAAHGEVLRRGRVYVAPGDTHLRVDRNLRIDLDPQPESLHRPSADELFRSVAGSAASSGVGVLLTGMGEDGAAGLLALRSAGGATMVQDESSSAVYGMPRAAHLLGAAAEVLPLSRMAESIARAVARRLPA